VELAWASTVVGVLCIGAGMAAHIVGYSNIAHDFGFVSGRENMCGYASIVGGSKNIDRGLYDFIAGHDNYIGPTISNAVIGGQHNKVYAGNSVAFGYNNEVAAGSASSLLVGDGLKAQSWCQTGVGRYNDYAQTKSDLFFVGKGSSNNKRSNAFRVDSNGNIYAAGNVYSNGKQISSGGGGVTTKWSGKVTITESEESVINVALSADKFYRVTYCLADRFIKKSEFMKIGSIEEESNMVQLWPNPVVFMHFWQNYKANELHVSLWIEGSESNYFADILSVEEEN
jgi:hypothetical protein